MKGNKKFFLCAGAVVGIGLVGYFICSKRMHPKTTAPTSIKAKKDLTANNPIPEEISLDEDASGVFFGKKPSKQSGYIGKPASSDGHILVVGGPGSGKTSAIAEPTARTWKGLTVSLLIKGNHRERICSLQKEGRRVITFDPTASDENRVRYNVFALLDRYPEARIDNACAIAEALLPLPEDTREPVWIQAGQAFLTGAILYYHSLGCSFAEMAQAISTHSILDIVQAIMKSGNHEAIGFASRLSAVDVKLLKNTEFELVSMSRFLLPQIMAALTVRSGDSNILDWDALNFATEPMDILLIIPEAKLDQWRPILTLMMEQLIRSLMNRPERTYRDEEPLPALLVSIDEFNRIGKIAAILSGLMTLRSRGVTFLLLVQSLASLDLAYGETASRVIQENCAYKIVLRVSEPKGQQYFSDLIGMTTTMEMSSSCGISVGGSIPAGINIGKSKSTTYTRSRRPCVFPEALAHLDNVLCITPYGTCHAAKTPCYTIELKK